MAASTTARSKRDVDNMAFKDAIWDSMNYTYGVKRDAIQQEFDRAYSQADQQAISRGMGRSSYNNQTLANINKQRADAIANNYNDQIADYERWRYQADRDEKADQQWQAQFDEGVRQFDTNLAYQRERAAAGDNQWNLQFNYGKERDAVADNQWQVQFDYGKERDTVADQQWQKQFDEGIRQFDDELAYKYYAHDNSKSGGGKGGSSNPGTVTPPKTDKNGDDEQPKDWQDFIKGLGIVTGDKNKTTVDPKSALGNLRDKKNTNKNSTFTRTISMK